MSNISNKVKGLIDMELRNIRDDLMQLCELKGVNIKKEIKNYFRGV